MNDSKGNKNISNIKKKVSIYYTILLIIAILVIFSVFAELICRYIINLDANTESVPYTPFFVSGNFYREGSLKSIEYSPEGPYSYGYIFNKGFFFNQFNPKRLSVNTRSDFLFNHAYSRYSSVEVDQLSNKNSDNVRIFIIGGSVARGSGASSKEKSWHALLEKKLRNLFENPNIYVFNCAIAAFISNQERIAFDFAVAPRKPDIVIDINGFNDVFIPLGVCVAPGDPLITGKLYAQIYDVSFRRFLKEHSILFRYFCKKRIHKLFADYKTQILNDTKRSEFLTKNITSIYLENMYYLIQRSMDMNIDFLVFLQPWRDLSLYESGQTNNSLEFIFHLNCYKEIISKFKQGFYGTNFYNLTGVFSTDKGCKTYTDIVHFNDEGHKIFSDAILDPIAKSVERILKRRKKTS